jgi:lycopene beta-cyclase
MKQKFDIGIIGAGLSGLTLANSLLNKKMKNFVLFERDQTFKNDKTYSFWTGPGLFDIKKKLNIKTKKEWSQIEIKVNGKSYIIDLGDYRYACYESHLVLKKLYKRIVKQEIIIERGTLINRFKRINDGWEIKVNSKKILLKNIVDSRPNNKLDNKYPSLKQVFIGSEIVSNEEIFNENVATLMDFYNSKRNVIFTYILPFSKNRALVETTAFSYEINFKELDKLHNQSLKKFRTKKILRIENAVLPMSPYSDVSVDDKYFKIGNFGGASRPSSGYAFTRIALWANQMDIKNKFTYEIINHKKNCITNCLDKIFLSVLRSNPQKAPKIFQIFFTRVPIASVIRFLSDQAKLVDYIAIILRLPKIIMLKGLLNLYVK